MLSLKSYPVSKFHFNMKPTYCPFTDGGTTDEGGTVSTHTKFMLS